jgi:hypothetical protein
MKKSTLPSTPPLILDSRNSRLTEYIYHSKSYVNAPITCRHIASCNNKFCPSRLALGSCTDKVFCFVIVVEIHA